MKLHKRLMLAKLAYNFSLHLLKNLFIKECLYYDNRGEVEASMDLKKAYEIMELPENSSIEELEKRFDILVRRMRGKTSKEETDVSEIIIKAYKTIKEFERQSTVDRYNEAKFGTNIRKKERSEKIEHFWIHHRWKVIASIAGIAVIAIVINIVIYNIKLANLPKPALEVMMYGDYYGANDQDLEKAILTKYADWERVKVIINYLPGKSASATDPAYVQKSLVVLATEHPDVYILDKATFKTMLDQNALTRLDSWKSELSTEHSADQLITGKQADDTETHLYGVDISDDPLWKSIGIPQNDKIAVLSKNLKNAENSKRLIINF
jgi:hypothetical protein